MLVATAQGPLPTYTVTEFEPLGTAHSQFPLPVVLMLAMTNEPMAEPEVTATEVGPAVAPGPLIVN